jgi:YtkA-like
MAHPRRHGTGNVLALLGLGAIAALAAEPPATAAPARTALEVGPGRVTVALGADRKLRLEIAPNRATSRNTITLRISRSGKPLHRAHVTASLTMQDMAMGTQTFHLIESRSGVYSYAGGVFVMAGSWFLEFAVSPAAGKRFKVSVVDHIET